LSRGSFSARGGRGKSLARRIKRVAVRVRRGAAGIAGGATRGAAEMRHFWKAQFAMFERCVTLPAAPEPAPMLEDFFCTPFLCWLIFSF